MADAPPYEIREITWSHVMSAIRRNSVEETVSDLRGDETSVVIRLTSKFRARQARDWLARSYDSNYQMVGYFHPGAEVPFAARFIFKDFSDKLLFALRWI